jgi:hypothetical protein
LFSGLLQVLPRLCRCFFAAICLFYPLRGASGKIAVDRSEAVVRLRRGTRIVHDADYHKGRGERMRNRSRNCTRIYYLLERILRGANGISQVDKLESRVLKAANRVEDWAQRMLELGDFSAIENILYARHVRDIVQMLSRDWREIERILTAEQV